MNLKFLKNIKNQNNNQLIELEKFIEDNSCKNVLVDVQNLSQSYGKKNIFNNLNFKIYENERLAILGSNGVGKTTIVEIIAGFKKPSSGKVIFNDQFKLNNNIGVQFQDLSFPRYLNVKDIIKFVIDLDEVSISEAELEEMVKVFELANLLDSKISKLSGGQKQRLNVLISLINKPKILFLDEFTTGLDIAIKRNIKDYILNYCQKYNMTLVIISHDIDIIGLMVDRIILIHGKQIVIDLTVDRINQIFGSVQNLLYQYIL